MHNNKYTHSSFRYFPCVRNHINASVNLGIWCALTKYIVWNLRVIYIGTVVAGMCACVEIYFLCYIVNTSVCIAPFRDFCTMFHIHLFICIRASLIFGCFWPLLRLPTGISSSLFVHDIFFVFRRTFVGYFVE